MIAHLFIVSESIAYNFSVFNFEISSQISLYGFGREFLSKSKQTTKVVLNDYYFLCVSGTI